MTIRTHRRLFGRYQLCAAIAVIAVIIAVRSVLLGGFIAAQAASDGPFGIYMGMPSYLLEQISEPDENGWIDVQSVPVPHPDFSRYYVLATRTAGVCGIMAGVQKNKRRADEIETKVIRQIDARYSGYNKVIEPIEVTIEDGKKKAQSKIEWSQKDKPSLRREGVAIITYFRLDQPDADTDSTLLIRFDFGNIGHCYESQRDQSNPF